MFVGEAITGMLATASGKGFESFFNPFALSRFDWNVDPEKGMMFQLFKETLHRPYNKRERKGNKVQGLVDGRYNAAEYREMWSYRLQCGVTVCNR